MGSIARHWPQSIGTSEWRDLVGRGGFAAATVRGLDFCERRAVPLAISLMKTGRVMQLGAFRQVFVRNDAAKE